MNDPTRDQIERRAYELWQQAGFPDGRDKEFTHQAERELRNEECATGSQSQRRFFDCAARARDNWLIILSIAL